MRRPEFIARQGRCPTGLLGRVLARVMAVETAEANSQLLALLEPRPTDHVLEVGFGHGRTVERAAALVPHGFVAGVDLSKDMVRMASRRNRQMIRARRVELQLGDSAHLPYPDCRFDRVFSLHTLYFWSDLQQHLREIHRVLKTDGRFVLGFGPRDDEKTTANFPAAVYRFYTSDEVRTLLAQVGFQEIDMIVRSVASRTIVLAVSHRR
jgi:ubiquinone/menaquinone biosynthesis C-methylase UbiE